MIQITATAESVIQARALLEAGIDTLYIGEERFGLRLPARFSYEEMKEITDYAHLANKEVAIAVNAIMHPEQMRDLPAYLAFLKSIQVDKMVVGDPGVVHLLTREGACHLPFIYDGATMVTNSRQINFWGKRGAIGAVVAREIPALELKKMSEHLEIFGEILVYGATAIHQSKRPLLQNYYRFIHANEEKGKARDLFLSEPKKPETHYAIFEDSHGTHIFAHNDLNMVLKLEELVAMGYTHWKLDGLYTPGEDFVKIAQCFVEAKKEIEGGTWNFAKASRLDEKIRAYHPKNRGLDEGFYNLDPKEIR